MNGPEDTATDGTSPRRSDPFDTSHLINDIRGRSIRGGVVTVITQCVRFGIRMLSMVVLARILTPNDFGLVAMVTALTGFAVLFRELGLSIATVQQSTVDHQQVSNLFWVNVSISLLISVVLVATAPLVGWFYGDDRLVSITRTIAVAFVFGGLRVQHRALLQRQMRFLALGMADITAIAAGVAAAIVAALYGAGYWSLVIMMIVTEAVAAMAIWISCPWRPGMPRHWRGARKMLRFGGDVTGFNIVNYFSRNLDNILIGRFTGAVALGFYSRAYGLLMLPLEQISGPISVVAIPALSRLVSDPERYRRYYLETVRLISLVTAPPIAFSVFFADDIIRIVLGDQWRPAGSIYALLGLSALAQPLYYTQGWLHLTTGHSRRYFRWGLISAAVFSAAFAVGVAYGAEGVAMAYTLAFLLVLPFCMKYAGHSAGIPLRDIARASGLPMLWSLGTAVVVKLLAMLLITAWSPVPRVAVAGFTGSVITFLWIYRMSPNLFVRIRQLSTERSVAGNNV